MIDDKYDRLFTENAWNEVTIHAEDHLKARHLPPDRESARRLAFGQWLAYTGRLSGEFSVRAEGAQP